MFVGVGRERLVEGFSAVVGGQISESPSIAAEERYKGDDREHTLSLHVASLEHVVARLMLSTTRQVSHLL